MHILIAYIIVAIFFSFRKGAAYQWYLNTSTNQDDSDGRLQMTISMFWLIMIPMYYFMRLYGDDGLPNNKLKRQFQVLCADYSVAKVLDTFGSETEALDYVSRWACEGHNFSIREVFTK